MKKIYNQPTCLTIIQLGTIHMMAESLPIGGGNTIDNPDDILVKGSTTTDINLWDKEW